MLHGDQPHHARRLRAGAVEHLVELRGDQARVGALGNIEGEAHALEPVDVELIDQFADRPALGGRPLDDQQIARRVGLGDGVGHDRVEQLLEFVGAGVFEHDGLGSKAGVGGTEHARLALGHAQRDDGVDAAAHGEGQIARLQRLLEERQHGGAGDRRRGLDGDHGVDLRIDGVFDIQDVAQDRLGHRLHVHLRIVEADIAGGGGDGSRHRRRRGGRAGKNGGANVAIVEAGDGRRGGDRRDRGRRGGLGPRRLSAGEKGAGRREKSDVRQPSARGLGAPHG